MSDGTRSSAMTAQAPASSAIFACSGVTTSMITPPLSIWARPFLTAQVPVALAPFVLVRSLVATISVLRRVRVWVQEQCSERTDACVRDVRIAVRSEGSLGFNDLPAADEGRSHGTAPPLREL